MCIIDSILGVGQFNSRLANKTVKNGYHILNLITNEKAVSYTHLDVYKRQTRFRSARLSLLKNRG